MTAFTPTHGIFATVVAIVTQIAFIATTFNKEQISSAYQVFLVFSTVLVPLLLTLTVIFDDNGSKKTPRVTKTKANDSMKVVLE